ncbi:MAG TPA: putative zinc-binding protein [bacterium]|nr:putative zinc-binding protein [bacterium]
MAEQGGCCCGGEKTLIAACSGAANTGQIANRLMLALDEMGKGDAFCLAGIGADISGFIASARAARTVVIDGCPVACGKKAFARHNLSPAVHLTVTDAGVKKAHDYANIDAETRQALAWALPRVGGASCCG